MIGEPRPTPSKPLFGSGSDTPSSPYIGRGRSGRGSGTTQHPVQILKGTGPFDSIRPQI